MHSIGYRGGRVKPVFRKSYETAHKSLSRKELKFYGKQKKGLHEEGWRGSFYDMGHHYKDSYRFKKIRLEKLKHVKGRCEICGAKARHIHHIDGDQNDQQAENLLAVCVSCHRLVHGGPYRSKYRRAYGMSLDEIANLLGVSVTTVGKWHRKGKLRAAIETGQAPARTSLFLREYGRTCAQIAAILGRSTASVRKYHQRGVLGRMLRDREFAAAQTHHESSWYREYGYNLRELQALLGLSADRIQMCKGVVLRQKIIEAERKQRRILGGA